MRGINIHLNLRSEDKIISEIIPVTHFNWRPKMNEEIPCVCEKNINKSPYSIKLYTNYTIPSLPSSTGNSQDRCAGQKA